ncbi:MAG: radical SAM protein [Clostridiales bacterium]|nr:radical SAM protein [Clostridia bacterium]MCR4882013.1 radical SAM protein [Clostridiales bacterium]
MPETMRIARIAPHLWEEPPISGTHGTGAVFFSGCTLRCVYCQNADISHRNAGRSFTPEALAESLRRLVGLGMETISFITATPFVPKILETLAIYRPPVPLVWNTSGYESVETLKMLDGWIDVYLPDLKHYSPSMSRLCAGTDDYFEKTSLAIQEMVRQCGTPVYDENGIMRRGVLIRHLILPGCTGESIRLLDWVHDNLPRGIPVSLMQQYVPCNHVSIPGLQRRITHREYARVQEHMLALELPGFYQGPTSATVDFIPVFNQEESFV